MKIGIVREIKSGEGRVALTPDNVKSILQSNPDHEVFIETQAGHMTNYEDDTYEEVGATILSTAAEVYAKADLIVHVKEPLPEEYPYLRKEHILFTYLHLAAVPELTKELMKIGLTGFAYETLESSGHKTPLLAPMSKVAGKMAFVYALYAQQKKIGGQGVYLGAIDGISTVKCVIIGGGVVGTNSAESLLGIGCNVTILEKNSDTREKLKIQFPNANILPDTELESEIIDADVVIGAVLVIGAKAPKLITKEQITKMKKGSVIVDVSIDQGGITEISRPTSIQSPTFVEGGVVICCIPNIPGTVPKTSTELLTKETLPYVIELANRGLDVLQDRREFQTALNIFKGKCTNKPVADAIGVVYTDLKKLL